MKETESPRPVGELEPPPTPTRRVEEDPTILARWLYAAYSQGPIFWIMLGGLAIVLMGVGALVSSLSAAKSQTGQAWIDLIPAKNAADQLKIADANPKTPIADWARLQAAYEEYRTGLDDLTAQDKRESAGPRLKRALDLFTQVAQEAPRDSPQSRGASLAVARVLEARNELPEAIKQYRLVAETYKDTPEARQAEALARLLESPESVQFYKDLYTAKPTAAPGMDLLKGMLDAPPGIGPGGKPQDLIVPGSSAAGKSFLPSSTTGPAGIDPPPSTPTPVPPSTPAATPAPATDPVPPASTILPVPSTPTQTTPPATPPGGPEVTPTPAPVTPKVDAPK